MNSFIIIFILLLSLCLMETFIFLVFDTITNEILGITNETKNETKNKTKNKTT